MSAEAQGCVLFFGTFVVPDRLISSGLDEARLG